MTAVQDAITAGAKVPTDRLGKLPRRVTVGIYADEQLAEEYERAVADLDEARERHRADADQRRGRAIALATDSGRPVADVLAELDGQAAAVLEPLQTRVAETLQQLDAATLWFTFRSLGRTPFREIVGRHPASAQDQEDWEAAGQTGKAPYAVESFARELVQLAAYQPLLSKADVELIADGEAWNEQEWAALYHHALAAQTAARAVTHRPAPRR